jgi:hypothetical protein
LTVTSAVAEQFLFVEGASSHLMDLGLHTIIHTRREAFVLSILDELIRPLRAAQVETEALSEIEAQFRQQKIARAKSEYASYLEANILSAPRDVAYFKGVVAQLENAAQRLWVLENPWPGRLVLALEKGGGPLLAVYDNSTFSALLNAARKPRGILDFELLGKAWRQQVFDGAYLEGVSSRGGVVPQVSTIVIASPETVGRLLVASEPIVAGFTDCCWVVEAADSPGLIEAVRSRTKIWQQIIATLRTGSPLGTGDAVRLSQEVRQAQLAFHQELALAGTDDRRYLAQVDRLVSKLAGTLHLAQNPSRVTSITRAQFAEAVGYAKCSVVHREAVLQITRQRVAEEKFRHRCEIVRNRVIALGPIRVRDLAHSFNDQSYKWLLPVLDHLVQTEEIIKRPDGRLDGLERWLSKLTFREC